MKKLFKDLNLYGILAVATFMDKLLFIFLIVFAVLSFFFVRELFPSGTLVKINLDNKTIYTFPLNEDRVVAVSGPIGESLIEINDGNVRVKSAPCPKKFCVAQGWIDKGAIVCLPNKLVVAVSGNEQDLEGLEYDGVTK